MQNHRRALARVLGLGASAMIAITLTACGGSGALGSSTPNFSNNAKVRFVNASPDAGSVDVFIDNQRQFCSSGQTTCPVAYATATGFAFSGQAGQHAIAIYPAGNDSGTPLFTGNFSVNSGYRYTVALEGEQHPAAGGTALTVATIPMTNNYNTPSGGGAVQFVNVAPGYSAANGGSIGFGFTAAGNTGGTMLTTSAVASNVTSGPIGLPSTALNTALTFYANSATSGITTQPSAFSTQCSTNSFPCDTGNLTLYLIDGSAYSTSPQTGGTGSSQATFAGMFDTNGF